MAAGPAAALASLPTLVRSSLAPCCCETRPQITAFSSATLPNLLNPIRYTPNLRSFSSSLHLLFSSLLFCSVSVSSCPFVQCPGERGIPNWCEGYGSGDGEPHFSHPLREIASGTSSAATVTPAAAPRSSALVGECLHARHLRL
ncbi:hypothetical protein KC19_3G147800 [Ceratodon purpureus]|uniref:Secreted protein n=1 Tax=Ceratodon purpureus TaxID=3225 RepID=A0A8T0IL30_CERPU|nr:hypothetical protein KC19_3G147800 [Ceratodon purpureus]